MESKATITTTEEKQDNTMELQQAFMESWLEALNDPIETRVIIETSNPGASQTWTDKEGITHTYGEYFMIDGSDGEVRNDDNKWMWSSSEGRPDDAYIKPEEVLPRALKLINSHKVTKIYNDVY